MDPHLQRIEAKVRKGLQWEKDEIETLKKAHAELERKEQELVDEERIIRRIDVTIRQCFRILSDIHENWEQTWKGIEHKHDDLAKRGQLYDYVMKNLGLWEGQHKAVKEQIRMLEGYERKLIEEQRIGARASDAFKEQLDHFRASARRFESRLSMFKDFMNNF
ncbi:hypothetical protein JXB02_06480 [Candidatus Woesearchaeota archaeon]|nr:hypothetical protein [Candidatus Woesearchaeota archaeon]